MGTEFKAVDVDLEDWIEEGVSYLQAEVTIYRDPAMFAKYGPLMERIKILENEIKPKRDKKERSLEESVGREVEGWQSKEESLGDTFKSEIDEELKKLYEEADELFKAYSANSEVWTLRRLNEDEVVAVKAEMGPLPEEPARPSTTKMTQAQVKAALHKMEEWSLKIQEYRDELNFRCLPLAVMKVEVQGKEKKVPSVDGFRRLAKRPGGDAHIKELAEAMAKLTAEGVSIMAPHREGTGA